MLSTRCCLQGAISDNGRRERQATVEGDKGPALPMSLLWTTLTAAKPPRRCTSHSRGIRTRSTCRTRTPRSYGTVLHRLWPPPDEVRDHDDRTAVAPVTSRLR